MASQVLWPCGGDPVRWEMTPEMGDMTVDELRHEVDAKFSSIEKGQLAITGQIDLLNHAVKNMEGTMLMTYQSIERSVVTHAHILDGENGNAGVRIELDRLKQSNLPERIQALEKVFWQAVGASAACALLISAAFKVLWR